MVDQTVLTNETVDGPVVRFEDVAAESVRDEVGGILINSHPFRLVPGCPYFSHGDQVNYTTEPVDRVVTMIRRPKRHMTTVLNKNLNHFWEEKVITFREFEVLLDLRVLYVDRDPQSQFSELLDTHV